ncbi:hypothetical protein T4B_3905 [Trichinella pseudospiralis]|uniref:Uncharacterized protein n=2 Tax=Trichinella pseudospiralis TaxID=6337 RepID=A0A0V1ETQ7_TRIPS
MGLLFVIICFSNGTFQESLMYSRNSKIDSALLDFVQGNSQTSPSLSRFSKTAESEMTEHFESARNFSTILNSDADMKPTLSAESFNSKAVESQELSITENETNMKSEPNQSVWNEASKNETELPLEKLIPIHDSTHNTYNPNNSQYLKPKSSKKFDFLASSSLSNDGSSKFIGNSNSEESLNSENPSSSADIANSNVCSNLSAEFTAASSKRESTLDSPITEDKSDNASNSCYNTSATRNPQKPVAAARNLSKSSTSHLT